MADKEKVAKSLTCTKACRNVTREKETGEFGMCWRKVCTFAHSEAELQPPKCSFDRTCRFKHGRNDRNTRKRIPDSQCKFRHSDETVAEYYKRSGVKCPDLPPTSEKTRKIPGSKPSSEEKYIAVPHPRPTPTLSKSKRKSRWDEKPEESPAKESPSEEGMHLMVNQARHLIGKHPIRSPTASKRWSYDSEDDSSSSESSSSESSSSESSDSEEERRRRRERSRRRSRMPTKSKKSPKKSPALQIIRLPTKELAAIAIKAAFDRGQYNVRVLVE